MQVNFLLEPKPVESECLYENEPMNPRLMAMILDLRCSIERHIKRRKYHHSREWL